MSELRNILEDSVTRLLAEQIDHGSLTRAEQQGWQNTLWDMLVEQGIVQVLASEGRGGMGAGWRDAFVVVRACGRHSVPLPVPEALVAHWLAGQAGFDLPDGVPGLLPRALRSDEVTAEHLDAEVARIPWGRNADFFIGLAATETGAECILTTNDGTVETTGENLAREPRDNVAFTATPIIARGAVALPPDGVRWLGALLRSAQIAGAAAGCLELAVKYTSEREQFGRPLSKFQAIQQHLAEMTGAMASVDSAALCAFDAMDRRVLGSTRRDARIEIATAKCRASEAVEPLTRIGHQVHGAFGFTAEYGLHFMTRRMWSWRAEFGGVGHWGEYLGKFALTAGGRGTWEFITS